VNVHSTALVSSSDAGRNFDLRCHLREGLVAWLQRNHPGSLPRLRAELTSLVPSSAAGGSLER
jgi:hypothetical protein